MDLREKGGSSAGLSIHRGKEKKELPVARDVEGKSRARAPSKLGRTNEGGGRREGRPTVSSGGVRGKSCPREGEGGEKGGQTGRLRTKRSSGPSRGEGKYAVAIFCGARGKEEKRGPSVVLKRWPAGREKGGGEADWRGSFLLSEGGGGKKRKRRG